MYNENMKIQAHAKVNFTLAINGVSGGYHMIDSVVSTVSMCDEIYLSPRRDGEITVKMIGCAEDIPPDKNNAYRAAAAYRERYSSGGADITVVKNIPLGGGLGGSSADTAGVLKGMNALYNLTDFNGLKALADGLGSDSGYQLSGGFAHISGRGERVEKIPFSGTLHLLLLLPERGVSTAECYRVYDKLRGENPSCTEFVKALKSNDITGVTRNLGNALYSAAASLNGDIPTAYNELCNLGALGVSMTGSGSGVFGIFESAEACARAREKYNGKFRCEAVYTV